jgi:flagellar basal body-associated protein FliL
LKLLLILLCTVIGIAYLAAMLIVLLSFASDDTEGTSDDHRDDGPDDDR